jgi:hypothetical protein
LRCLGCLLWRELKDIGKLLRRRFALNAVASGSDPESDGHTCSNKSQSHNLQSPIPYPSLDNIELNLDCFFSASTYSQRKPLAPAELWLPTPPQLTWYMRLLYAQRSVIMCSCWTGIAMKHA